ncbi:MAG: hypothetical protein ACRCX2_04570 [Paraclostridium sp.]
MRLVRRHLITFAGSMDYLINDSCILWVRTNKDGSIFKLIIFGTTECNYS